MNLLEILVFKDLNKHMNYSGEQLKDFRRKRRQTPMTLI